MIFVMGVSEAEVVALPLVTQHALRTSKVVKQREHGRGLFSNMFSVSLFGGVFPLFIFDF